MKVPSTEMGLGLPICEAGVATTRRLQLYIYLFVQYYLFWPIVQLFSYIFQLVDDTLGQVSIYDSSRSQDWVDKIAADSLNFLQELNPNFKYIVQVSIIQKGGG